ncbi:zinc finger MYM-type protein 1-like [Chenopodium quinoa]|uniref:zinc finger MYM-type protein 1-like n=1 Tax=Chenopodium quinoa TaxID=63459 RepID=UPI000B77548A|nr:zinc finger MYM-type protein 1-like [Chenopodium quinoa]
MSLSLEHSRYCLEGVQAARTQPDVPQDKTVSLNKEIMYRWSCTEPPGNKTPKVYRKCSNSVFRRKRIEENGEVTERFLGIIHVADTKSLTLKPANESLLKEHSLTFSRVRGQGYDGDSNMQENADCGCLFVDVLAPLLNFVGGSPKRKEFLRQKQAEHVAEALTLGELESGTGLNQERSLSRLGDTRWVSHFRTILNVLNLYPTILESLDDIGAISDRVDRTKAESLTHLLMTFDFIFVAHLMKSIFSITNELNMALQKSDHDIVNAMTMIDVTKINLQELRDDGWDSHIEKVTTFMVKYDIEIPNMEGKYAVPGR